MAKKRRVYVCSNCSYQSEQYIGRCPSCKKYSTLEERASEPEPVKSNFYASDFLPAQPINSGKIELEVCIPILPKEFSRVLGGGLVQSSAILFAAFPGAGKSTLALIVAHNLASAGHRVLYASGEESLNQIKSRASRLGALSDNLYLLSTKSCDFIIEEAKRIKPTLLIVDSIQTVALAEFDAAAGQQKQVMGCAAQLTEYAKTTETAVLMIGHVVKSGGVAGAKTLQHIVDTVLFMEGDLHDFRIIRCLKNRFGATNEIGVFEMTGEGLIEIPNPSERLLAERDLSQHGSAVTVLLEGVRPITVEVQALTIKTEGNPFHQANGVGKVKLQLLNAVLSKQFHIPTFKNNIFVNVIGNIKIQEQAADLAIIAAIASSYYRIPIPPKMIMIGEVGLNGEVRSVHQIHQRLQEAARIGFNEAIIPASVKDTSVEGIKLIKIRNIMDLFKKGANDANTFLGKTAKNNER